MNWGILLLSVFVVMLLFTSIAWYAFWSKIVRSLDQNQELIDAAKQLLNWQPICSQGSSGDLRQRRLRTAISEAERR